MLNPLRRIVDRDRTDIAPLTMRPQAQPIDEPPDDYLVEGDEEPDRQPTGARVIQGLQVLLIAILAVLSLAVFWLIAMMLNIL